MPAYSDMVITVETDDEEEARNRETEPLLPKPKKEEKGTFLQCFQKGISTKFHAGELLD